MFVLLVIAAVSSLNCDLYHPAGITKAYQCYYNNNVNNRFYIEKTFGLNIDPCAKVKKPYKEYLKNIPCDGEWCNGEYNCTPKNISCYNVVHIYDCKGHFNNCDTCKDIAGNRIMAWNKWASGVDKLKGTKSMDEKIKVYGPDIVKRACLAIKACSHYNETFDPCDIPQLRINDDTMTYDTDSADTDISLDMKINYILILLAVMIVVNVVAIFKNRKIERLDVYNAELELV